MRAKKPISKNKLREQAAPHIRSVLTGENLAHLNSNLIKKIRNIIDDTKVIPSIKFNDIEAK